jgi:hypothetical protein
MLKFQPAKVNNTDSFVYDPIIDFARESQIINKYEDYYVTSADLKSEKKLRLFIVCPEEITEIYFFDEADSYYIRYLYKDIKGINKIKIPWEVISKYLLVRVIPPNGVYGMDSYYRVVLKSDFNSAKPITIEDELYKQK